MLEWIDCHVHVLDGTLADVEELNKSQRDDYGCSASNFLSVEGMDDAAQNAMAIYFKLLNPQNYAFGGLHHRFAYDTGIETRRLWEIGLDGIKMIENKPNERKRLGIRQDDERLYGLYEAADELDIPLLIHVNDPVENWQWDACSEWAKNAGYYYGDGTFPTYEQIAGETIAMLARWPKVRFCLAHLFFMSNDEPRLRRLMEQHPNLHLDITAGTEMYDAFNAAPEVWRTFFLDYADRIMFGTDNCLPAGAFDRKIAHEINELERNFLTRSDRFPLWDRSIQGAGLPETALRQIAADNFRRFAGCAPRPLNREKAAAYLQERLQDARYALTRQERTTISGVLKILRQTD